MDGHYQIQGNNGEELKVRVTDEGGTLNIYPDGYGDCCSEDEYGVPPIFVELWDGRLRLVAFPDINKEEPVIIDMELARETNRKD